MISVLNMLDGVFAFAYWQGSKVIIARDLIGVKPLWYSQEKGLAFASEKQALEKDFSLVNELNPRTIIVYDIEKNNAEFRRREFFRNTPEHTDNHDKLKEELKGLYLSAVSKRAPGQKAGLFFSGGVDSTMIALTLKRLGVDFTCYTSAITGDRKSVV